MCVLCVHVHVCVCVGDAWVCDTSEWEALGAAAGEGLAGWLAGWLESQGMLWLCCPARRWHSDTVGCRHSSAENTTWEPVPQSGPAPQLVSAHTSPQGGRLPPSQPVPGLHTLRAQAVLKLSACLVQGNGCPRRLDSGRVLGKSFADPKEGA